MKIKRVEIVGFKSFVDKVSLDFQEGVTAILGPNGCGKSNIVDAIRWAMGEQNAKNLRGRSMEDVIFGGSESHKPLGMAEVSMIFANEDGLAPAAFRNYAEIMVTRRLYRNGESEYLLNKTPCRLRDISELFMDTGGGARAYSIIEQGKIGMILNAKPEDRRFLIEEAAGVTKFKSRKKTALRKIEATRHNLQRLGDIISEVRRQLGSLKRQAQKAQKYRDYREELKQIETAFARQRHAELLGECEALTRLEKEQSRVLEGLSADIARAELALEELRLVQAGVEKDVNRGQARAFHLVGEIQKIEGRIGFGAKELASLERQKQGIATESEEVARQLGDSEREEETLQEDRETLGQDLEQERRRLAEGERQLDELVALEQELSAALEAERSALYQQLAEHSRLSSTWEEARRRLESQVERTARNRAEAVSLREQSEETLERIAALQGTLTEFRKRRGELEQEREQLQETGRTLRRQVEENENALLIEREELNRHRSRLESLRQLEQGLGGDGGGVKAVLGDAGLRGRLNGMAADALEVPPRYEVAVEAVLGDRLQSLLATTSQGVLDALAWLRQKEGRCTFLVPGFAADSPALTEGAPLEALVGFRPGTEQPLRALLAGAFLVESLEPFLTRRLPVGVILVTESGESLTFRGECTGGGRQSLDQGLLHKKREINELAERVERLNHEVELLHASRIRIREALGEAEEGSREVEAAIHRKELKLVDSEKDLARIRGVADRLEECLEVLSLEEDRLLEERQDLEVKLAEAARGRQANEEQKADLEQSVVRLTEELQVVRGQVATVREQVSARKVVVASTREREEASRSSLARLSRVRGELLGRRVALQQRATEAETEQVRLRAEAERLAREIDVLFRRREEEAARLNAARERFAGGAGRLEIQQESLNVLRSRFGQVRETLGECQLRGRELRLELEHLQQNMLERYRFDLAAGSAVFDSAPFDATAAEVRRKELRQHIDAMGEVNLMAIEEYQELEERSNFLVAQQEDLRESLEGLQSAITKINLTTRRRFRETFDLVNAKFQEVFPRLFRGGKAELKLTDEQDLLETGIEIIAQPPGKKLQSVNLLSGGEKALAAAALVFSIFLIKPSPFCMLDEVDAPLDEANIGRFNDIVREMAKISQFIIITHNKRTMEIADLLYGVTMEEPGISKLVSVRMTDF